MKELSLRIRKLCLYSTLLVMPLGDVTFNVSCDSHVTKWLLGTSRPVKTLMAGRQWETAHWPTFLRFSAVL